MERIGHAERSTKEVEIQIEIHLDKPGSDCDISITSAKEEPGFGFEALTLFEHLFAQIYKHGRLGGNVRVQGDLPHHVIEDAGITWGLALKEALGERRGIERFGSLIVPFEGSIASVSIDLSGRGHAVLEFHDIIDETLAGMVQHLFEGMALNAGFNIYAKLESIAILKNDHHKLEALCKAFGKVLYRATRITGLDTIPSTKGVL